MTSQCCFTIASDYALPKSERLSTRLVSCTCFAADSQALDSMLRLVFHILTSVRIKIVTIEIATVYKWSYSDLISFFLRITGQTRTLLKLNSITLLLSFSRVKDEEAAWS